METTRKTIGVDPKVPVQAIATVIVALAAYFGLELSEEVSVALAVVLGTIAGIAAPAPNTQEVRK